MAIATVADVIRRLEDAPTDRVLTMIEEYLEDASDQARFYGSPAWHDQSSTPAEVQRIVAAAVARFIRNPDAYTQSRAADEMLGWQEVDDPGSVKFTEEEKARLARYKPGPLAKFGTFDTTNWGHKEPEVVEYVPWQGDERPFPFIAYNDPLRKWKR